MQREMGDFFQVYTIVYRVDTYRCIGLTKQQPLFYDFDVTDCEINAFIVQFAFFSL